MSAQNLAPQPYRCPACGSASMNPRNLALFIDGTANKPGVQETNVKKLYDAMYDEDTPKLRQNKKYFEGIGAYDDFLPSVGRLIYSGFDMAVAWNAERNVKSAYRWLVETYEKGDQIYLFGFSRGAYQVRALAGMIHEVGLLRKNEDRVEQAHRHYISINPRKPGTRKSATEFKKNFCHAGVRIHFIGVWDTVSSLGLLKQDVYITASASVTNACHFRHALALDERRVKFMPEYFLEMNAHKRSSRSVAGDVKEVWFAGCHGDVGGISRPHHEVIPNPLSDEDSDNPIHAGNVPLVWMEREAASEGLAFKSKGFVWNPEDVDLGRHDSMSIWWRLLEYIPIRHQVSFSGTGKDEWRRHLSRPRLVIPGQYIHSSVLPGDVYTPRATFACGVNIPTVPQKGSSGLRKTEPWRSEFLDEKATTHLLTSLLSDQEKTLNSIWEVLLLLDFRLDTGQTQNIPIPGWLSETMLKQPNFEKFTLTVIHDTISYSSTRASDWKYSKLVEGAKKSLEVMLSPGNQSYYPQVFYVIRFSSRHKKLRQHFIAYKDIISGLIRALEYTARSPRKNLFPLVADSLCYLMQDEENRDYIISQLTAMSDETESGTTRLSQALDTKVRVHLIASLTMVATLAQYASQTQAVRLREELKSKIRQLARYPKVPVGSAAVGALVALGEQQNVADDFHFYNVLGYLRAALQPLDAEVGDTPSPDIMAPLPSVPQVDSEVDGASESSSIPTTTSESILVPEVNWTATSSYATLDLPPVFRIGDSGELDANDVVMCKLLQTIEARDAQQRIVATLTLLKLCQYSIVRDFCSEKNVTETFIKQLERKDTSLLGAYALNTCLKLKMWKPGDFARAVESIKTMLNNGWFDDAVGRVEGFNIFRELMTNACLRQQLMNRDIVTVLVKKLEVGDHHEIRMSLISLDILTVEEGSLDLQSHVNTGIDYLDKDQKTQQKGVKILAALAQTEAGEQAIQPRLADIVEMLLLSADDSIQPRSQLLGPAAALYELCKNETLRKQIKESKEYGVLKRLRLVKNLPYESRAIR